MSQRTRSSGLLAAALGVALGMLLLAPAMNGTLGPASASASSNEVATETGSDASTVDGVDSSEALRAEEQADAANALLAAEAETILADKLADVPVTVIRTAGAHDEDVAGVRAFAETRTQRMRILWVTSILTRVALVWC